MLSILGSLLLGCRGLELWIGATFGGVPKVNHGECALPYNTIVCYCRVWFVNGREILLLLVQAASGAELARARPTQSDRGVPARGRRNWETIEVCPCAVYITAGDT